jgi:hypothetical protein
MIRDIEELYFIIDELVKHINKNILLPSHKGRPSILTKSELILILIIGHFHGLDNDKQLY